MLKHSTVMAFCGLSQCTKTKQNKQKNQPNPNTAKFEPVFGSAMFLRMKSLDHCCLEILEEELAAQSRSSGCGDHLSEGLIGD